VSIDRVRALRAVGTAGPLVFTLDWLLLGRAHRGYAPARETISSLSAHDAAGWPWMVGGQVAMAAGCLALAVLVRWRLGPHGTLGAALMVLAAYGILQASAFRTICNRSDSPWCTPLPRTAYGHQQWLHGIGTGIAFGTLVTACFAVAWAARHARLPDLARVSSAAGLVCLPLVAWFLLSAESAWHGLSEKLFLLTLAGWTVYSTRRLAAGLQAGESTGDG